MQAHAVAEDDAVQAVCSGVMVSEIGTKLRHLAAAAALRQLAGRRLPELISEYLGFEWVPVDAVSALSSKLTLKASMTRVRAGSKLLYLNKGEVSIKVTPTQCRGIVISPDIVDTTVAKLVLRVASLGADPVEGTDCEDVVNGVVVDASWFCVFGVYRTPQEWHSLASAMPFPPDSIAFLRPWHAKAIYTMLTNSPLQLNRLRKQRLVEIADI
eukprot:6492248-Amphidinium_carterae.1